MFRKALTLVAAAAIFAVPLAAAAQYNGGDAVLPSSTVITGTLEQTINSRTALVGDAFVLDVQQPYPMDDPRFQGARVYGHVARVDRAGGMHKGSVSLAFDRLTMMDGTTAALQGQVLSIDVQGNKSNSTVKTIAGAVAGLIIGNYIGKHIGTDVGGAIGGAGGAILAANSGQNVVVGQGTTVSLKTTAPATILSRRQAGYGGNGYHENGPQSAPTAYPTPYH